MCFKKVISPELVKTWTNSSRNVWASRNVRAYRKGLVAVKATYENSVGIEMFSDSYSDDGGSVSDVNGVGVGNLGGTEPVPVEFRNRFLNFARFGSIVSNAAESFFKSEIRRRLFVTACLIVISRLGYFIPLPGFDRRLMPENYLSFVSGSVGECLLLCFKFMYHLDVWAMCALSFESSWYYY